MSFRFSDEFQKKFPDVEQKWIQVCVSSYIYSRKIVLNIFQTLLRSKGWIVPNYELPPDLEKVEILRVVVRENTTGTSIHQLVTDLVCLPEGNCILFQYSIFLQDDITESLKSPDSVDALATLAEHSAARRNDAALKVDKDHEHDEGDGRGAGKAYTGTYAKPC